jgi:hypothetical protein
MDFRGGFVDHEGPYGQRVLRLEGQCVYKRCLERPPETGRFAIRSSKPGASCQRDASKISDTMAGKSGWMCGQDQASVAVEARAPTGVSQERDPVTAARMSGQ